MIERVRPSAALLDVLPRASRSQSTAWGERTFSVTLAGSGAPQGVTQSAENDVRALATWLLALDHLLCADSVGIVLRSAWLALSVDRKLTIAAWTDVVREALSGPLADIPPDAEISWGAEQDAPSQVCVASGLTGDDRLVVRFRTSKVSEEGAGILAALWSVASRSCPQSVIEDIAWHEATGTSVNRDENWSRTEPRDVPSCFDEVVRRDPGRIAVVQGDRQWTYKEVDEISNSIAETLVQQHGVELGEIVAIALPRGMMAIASMLGVLRAGAAYMPLEMDDPADRIRHILQDASTRVLICDGSDQRASAVCAQNHIRLLDASRIEPAKFTRRTSLSGDALAYVMFTSGSTGQPKGVEVCHRGITRLVLDCNFMPLDHDTAMLQAAPLGFDASTLEIWGPLLNGGRCIVHDEEIPTGPGLAQTIKRHGARAAWLTSALFNAIVDGDARDLAGLETLLIGGEALSVSHVKKFLRAVPETHLINGYGPTETTTFAATHPIKLAEIENAPSIPIGQPINATAHYVLNKLGEPIARGLIGELYIGGLGVGRGYLNRTELTAERFLPDRFAGDGRAMYRTGDYVRMLADGKLEFAGRIDGQVKIRGFRIETGEIELTLSRLPEVRSCAVVAQLDPVRGAELVAYVVPSADNFSISALKQQLGLSLPEYMIPVQWVRLETLPVTANGKLDRRQLPLPSRTRPDDLAHPYVEPAADTERAVADAMARSLGLDRVGALDNFFELGGNSLLVLRTLAALREAGYKTLSVAHFFADPTPRAIARMAGTTSARLNFTVLPQVADEEPIAVVGMAGRFPGAPDIESFWQVLCEGRETIKFFSADELDASIPSSLRRDPRYVPARGVISDVEMFDAAFFGISPREAELMDPQQRIFLEIAWECLERAGHVPEKTRVPIGVFAGMHNATYYAHHVRAYPDKIARLGEFLVMLGNEKDYITTRTAHKLGLTGPAVNVQSACSTSLVAIAQAFDALRAGQCGMALAGGASITCPPNSGYLYQEGAMLSPDGHTRTFDEDAQGTVFSDGAAVVLLKRLSDAIADGNTIYAVMRAVSVNNDGAGKASFTAPSVKGQADLVRSALARARVSARSIDYVEAHGTATPLGDPVEVAALTEAFRDQTSDTGFCALGSLKSNTGHMVIAAGAAGLIKTALSLYHEVLPPTLHFTSPNPKIDFADSPFVVNSSLRPWTRGDRPRRAGVSSFGVGGTNAHAIMEEAPLAPPAASADVPYLVRVSARTPSALKNAVARLAGHLERNPALALADVAHTLDVGRRDFAHRAVVVAESVTEAAGALADCGRSREAPTEEHQPILMFPGQGSQYAGMGRDLYARNPEARRQLDACFDALAGEVEFDLRARMFSDDPSALSQTQLTQPATFALEYALAKLWLSRGVVPRALAGHSVGEFVAATLAGVMSLEDAVRLVARRGAIMQALPPGAMLSVRMSASDLEPLLPESVDLAAENGPTACVVAGPAGAIEAFAARLNKLDCATRLLSTSHAFHSAMMDPAIPLLQDAVDKVRLSAPQIPIASTLTGGWLSPAEAVDTGYWLRHMRQPVRFSKAVSLLLAEVSQPLFLEAGPGTALCSLVRQHRKSNAVPRAVASLGSDPSRELRLLTEAAGQVWLAGCACSWPAGGRRVVLPTYPFERQRHWLDAVKSDGQAPVIRLAAPEREPPETVVAVAKPVSAGIPEATPSSQATSAMSTNPMSKRHTQLVQRLRGLFEDVSGIELDEADPSQSFIELGLDSLTLTQVALQLKSEFSLPITFRQLMESFRSFDALATHLDANLPADAPAPAAEIQLPASAPVPATAAILTPQALLAPAAGSMPLVQQVIQQQMALMAQQLSLLQGQPVTAGAPVPQAFAAQPPVPQPAIAPSAPAQPEAPAAKPSQVPANATVPDEAALAHTTYDVKKAFGAIARIHTTSSDLTERQRTRLDAFIRRYTEKTQKSKSYTTEHRPHLADPRVVNGFRPPLKEIIYQIVIERSKGAQVWDLDGNCYVDALNGFGMSLFGWQPDFVLEAVRKQLDAGYEIGPQHPLAGPVAKLMCELTGFDRAGLCNTGSEAVMGCVRIARTVTGRSKIAIFSGAYHGIFDEVIVRGTRKGKAVPAAPGIMKNTAENVVVLDYATPETLQWLKDNASDLAAVLVEPVQSRRPDLQPREFLRELRALTSANGSLLIFDEVVTGFRSHPGGAQALFDVRADLASYGKVVGGGFPVGVIAGKREYMDALDGGHWEFGDASIPTVGVTYFAGTFVRHPLALAAAYAVLQHLKEQGASLQNNLTANTASMVDELNAYCREVGAPITLKHFSSVWKIFFDEDHPYQDLLFAMMRNRGVHILDNFPCFMTTAHNAEAIAIIMTAFKEAVAEMQQSDFLPRRLSATVLSLDASRPPMPGARLGRDADGKPAWFVANPDAPGKFIKVEAQ